MVCKIIFHSKFSDIPDKAGRVTRGRTEAIAKHFAFHANAIQSNLFITTTWGTKFVWSLWAGSRYKEDLYIAAKTVNSDIWSLFNSFMTEAVII